MAIGSRAPVRPDEVGEMQVAKPQWGAKRECQQCGARFYDLNRSPVECLKCGAVFDPAAASRAKRSRPVPPAPKPKAPPVPADLNTRGDNADTLSDDDDEDDVIEDATELGEDEDDVSDVMDGVAKEKVDT